MLSLRLASVLAASLPLFAAINEPVQVDSGLLTGTAGSNPEVRVFKGVPFATPPVGDLRWRAPKSAAKWEGVRAADKFSANCMQRAANGGAFPPNGGDRSAGQMSEDCLYLNIYTAAKSAKDKRPVMVWIHGGAFTSGAGAIYEGEELAAKGVVVVTVNYRLGVFGFFAHPELTKGPTGTPREITRCSIRSRRSNGFRKISLRLAEIRSGSQFSASPLDRGASTI
jgi:para-nitrobenzyl esterase